MATICRVEVGRSDYALVGEFKFFKAARRPSVLDARFRAEGDRVRVPKGPGLGIEILWPA